MAVRFSASGQSYTLSTSPGALTQLTVCTWMKIDVDRNTFSSAWSLDAGTSDYVMVQTNADGTTLVNPLTDGATLAAATSLTVGTWYFIGVSINGTACTTILRTEGSSVFTTYPSTLASGTVTPTTLRIGESPFSGDWPNGSVAAVKIWTGATLTALEMQQESGTSAAVRSANLFASYPFATATTADSSGNGRTLSGGVGAVTATGPSMTYIAVPLFASWGMPI